MEGERASAVEVMLGASSLGDALDRIELSQRVAALDARIADEAELLRRRVVTQERRLASAASRQQTVVNQRAAERRAIESRLADRQRLLSSVKDELARMEEAERRRQAELRRQAQFELERQRRLAEQQRAEAERQRALEVAASEAQQAAESQPAPLSIDRSSVALETSAGSPSADPLTAPAAPPADAGRSAQVVSIAMQYLGTPYVWGAADPSVGFDCSGLTSFVFAQIGVSLPHFAAAQYTYGTPVSKDQLQPGDLVFFRGLGHMGMYIGGGSFIHAPRTGDVVKISSLSEDYYTRNWVGARRVL